MPDLGLFVVADGMGGYEGGEVAARLAVETIREFIETQRRDPDGTWPQRADTNKPFEQNLLLAATVAAHRRILEQRVGGLKQMGSTVVTALVHADQVTVAHVGDSRCYRLRNGVLTALTSDHSLWAELSAQEGSTAPRAQFPWKNCITRALGLEGHAQADVCTTTMKAGDCFLLCSDGLYDPLNEGHLVQMLQSSPKRAVKNLVDAAFDAGSHDNITAVVFRLEQSLFGSW